MGGSHLKAQVHHITGFTMSDYANMHMYACYPATIASYYIAPQFTYHQSFVMNSVDVIIAQ